MTGVVCGWGWGTSREWLEALGVFAVVAALWWLPTGGESVPEQAERLARAPRGTRCARRWRWWRRNPNRARSWWREMWPLALVLSLTGCTTAATVGWAAAGGLAAGLLLGAALGAWGLLRWCGARVRVWGWEIARGDLRRCTFAARGPIWCSSWRNENGEITRHTHHRWWWQALLDARRPARGVAGGLLLLCCSVAHAADDGPRPNVALRLGTEQPDPWALPALAAAWRRS